MAEVTITARVQTGPTEWRIDWEDTSAERYRVFLDGVLYAETANTAATVIVEPGETGLVQVFDADDGPAFGVPARVHLRWEAVTGAVRYRVERFDGAAFFPQAEIAETEWLSPPYPAGLHRFRVTALDATGVQSDAWEQEVRVVRRPPALEGVTVGVSGGTVTVSP